jgi:hypothetical protein
MTNYKNLTFAFIIISSIIRLIPELANFSTWVIGLLSIMGPMQIIISLIFSWIFSSLNLAIFPELNEVGLLGRYFNFLLAFAYISFKINYKINKKFILISIFTLLSLIVHSFYFSSNPNVSALKSFLFILVIFISIYSWKELDLISRNKLFEMIFLIILFFVIISVFLLFHEYGKFVNNSGFQGIFNHPQVFGIILLITITLYFINVSNNSQIKIHELLIMSVLFILLLESKSRTAFLSFSLVILTFTLVKFYEYYLNRIKLRYFVKLFVISLFSLFFAYSFNFTKNTISGINNKDSLLTSIILKDSKSDNIIDAAIESRGSLINENLYNVNILFGNGFGNGSPTDKNVKFIPNTIIPISFPVEKGVLPFAVYNEFGLFGVIIIFIIISYLLIKLIFDKYFTLYLSILLSNFGEFTIFSTGGIGLLQLVLLTFLISNIIPYNRFEFYNHK